VPANYPSDREHNVLLFADMSEGTVNLYDPCLPIGDDGPLTYDKIHKEAMVLLSVSIFIVKC
jgi:hypothetical protein